MFKDCILFNSKKLERSLTKIAEEEFANIGLHHTYGYILSVVARAGYTKTKNISCELALDSSTVTRMVSKLEREGLIKKGSDNSPCDISLTTAGEAVMPEVIKAWDAFHKRVNDMLGEDSAEQIVQELNVINQKLDIK